MPFKGASFVTLTATAYLIPCTNKWLLEHSNKSVANVLRKKIRHNEQVECGTDNDRGEEPKGPRCPSRASIGFLNCEAYCHSSAWSFNKKAKRHAQVGPRRQRKIPERQEYTVFGRSNESKTP